METAIIEINEVETRALSVPEQAKAIVIRDDAGMESANELLLAIKDIRKQINEVFDPPIKAAHDSHKAAIAAKQKVERPLADAEGIIKPKMAEYHAEQIRLRREEEMRLQAEAQRFEEERRLQEAILAEACGDKAEAEALLDEPVLAPVVVLPQAPKLNGTSFREVWKWKIVARDLIPKEYMMLDEVKISGVVRSMKGMTHIPGILAYPEKVVASGRR